MSNQNGFFSIYISIQLCLINTSSFGIHFISNVTLLRKMSERDAYGPVVDHLSKEEVDALEAREERLPR